MPLLFNIEEQKALLHAAVFANEAGYPFSESLNRPWKSWSGLVANENSVEIEYRTSHEEQPRPRVIDPYGMLYWNNKWYTVGFCHLRNEIRIFRAERIFRIQRTQIMFKRPEAFSARKFFSQSLLPDFESKDGVVSLIISGRSEALDDLCIHWFLGHYLKERTLNQAIFLLDERSLHAYVPYFLLSYGKAIKVIEPQSLKKKLVSIASELKEYYQL